MTYPVRIRPEAESEILNAQVLYSAIDEQLGLDVRASIVECIERISLQPELYAATYGKVCPVTLRRFPFILSYVFENDVIVVIGLVHSSIPHELWNQRS